MFCTLIILIDDILHDNPKVADLRFTRVAFDLNSSLFLLNATIDYHIRSYTADVPGLRGIISKSVLILRKYFEWRR